MAVLAIIGKILLILLKIIGWTVVGILGLILLILLIVLFLPVGYKVEAAGAKNAEGADAKAHVCVHLLLRLIQADIDFRDRKLDGWLRIAWIRKHLIGGEKEKKDPKPEEEATESLAEQIAGQEPDGVEEAMVSGEPEPKPPEKPEPAAETQPPEEPEPEAEPHMAENPEPHPEPFPAPEPEETAEEKPASEYEYVLYYGAAVREIRTDHLPPIFLKIGEILQKIGQIGEKASGAAGKISATVQKLEEKLYQAEKIWYEIEGYPDRPYLQKLLFRQLKKIGRNLRPCRLEVDGTFGMADPVLTANLTSVYGMLGAWTGDIRHYHLDLTPDFEHEILEGSALIQGRIQLSMVVLPLLRIAISRRVWRLVKYVLKRRKKETSHGN